MYSLKIFMNAVWLTATPSEQKNITNTPDATPVLPQHHRPFPPRASASYYMIFVIINL